MKSPFKCIKRKVQGPSADHFKVQRDGVGRASVLRYPMYAAAEHDLPKTLVIIVPALPLRSNWEPN